MQCFILLKQVVKRRVAKDDSIRRASDRNLRTFRCPVHADTARDERSEMDPTGTIPFGIYKIISAPIPELEDFMRNLN